jgi:phosphoribosylamine--glycine ligase
MTHILVVGKGGRAHALAWKLALSPRVDRVTVAPGNGGTGSFAENVDIDATDVVSLLDYAESQQVDLTVIGPEEPLANGIVDQFEAAGLPIFGPRREAALIETSKSFAKQLMAEYAVPTAPYEVFDDLDGALDYLASHSFQDMVIKADGITRGTGMFVPRGESDAEGILRSLLERDALGRAGRRVVIEQRLLGEEYTLMAFTDGHSLAMMPPVREHRRLHDQEIGPGTAAMGCFAPAPVMTPHLLRLIRDRILLPVLEGLQAERCCFRGIINAGVVLTRNGPMVRDLNTRLGDPAAQTVLPLLATDLLDVIDACINGTLGHLNLRWHTGATATVSLVTNGYPEHDDPGLPIIQAPVLPPSVIMFHSGTRIAADGALVTDGGRVLDITGIGPDLPGAITSAYDAVRRVHFDGMYYRSDVGTGAFGP